MLQLTPQSRIFLATEPVDFRKGIDGLGAVCRQRLGQNPIEGAVYVFRNRAATALKLLFYDGQGYWFMTSSAYTVLTTPRSDRLLRSLNRPHSDLTERFAAAIAFSALIRITAAATTP
jgi:transposase